MPLPAELAGAGLLAAGLVVLLRRLDAVRAGRRRPGEPEAVRRSGDKARAELAARIGQTRLGSPLLTGACGASRAPSEKLLGRARGPRCRARLGLPRRALRCRAPGAARPLGHGHGHDFVGAGPIGTPRGRERRCRPFPTLVSLGVSDDEARALVLVNLEAAGVLAFGGDERAGAEVVASIAVELATVPWAQECRLYLHGLGQRTGLGVAEPVRVVDDVGDCVRELEAVAAATRAATIDHGGVDGAVSSVGEMRLRSDDPTDLGPAILVCAAPADPELVQRLAVLAADPASGLLAVLMADPGGQRWLLDVDIDGTAEVGPACSPSLPAAPAAARTRRDRDALGQRRRGGHRDRLPARRRLVGPGGCWHRRA